MARGSSKHNQTFGSAMADAFAELERLRTAAVRAGAGGVFWTQPVLRDALDKLFQVSSDDYYIYDAEGRFLYVSEHGLMHGRHDRSELIGKTWRELDTIPAPFLKPFEDMLATVVTTGRSLSRESSLPVDGVLRRLAYNYAPLIDADGRVDAVIATVRDVTAALGVHDALRASEEKWRSLVASAPNLIVLADAEGRITFVNRTRSGRKPEDLVGTSIFDLAPAGDGEWLRDALTRARTEGQVQFEMPGPDGHGGMAHYQANIGPLRMHDEVTGYILIVTDVSELKQATTAVAERTAELTRAQELDRLKNNFVNAVTHELRTPLTSIRGYAEFLEDDVGGSLTEDQRLFVRQLLAGADRLERLVDDLLDFARIEAGTFSLRIGQADLAAKIHELLASLTPQARDAKLTLRAEGLDQPIVLPMDAPRIGQVLLNLLNNAIKFTEPGGTITVRARVQDGQVRCEVTDTGTGIAEADMPKLFQRFSQLENGQRSGGTGLGLSISKAIVEAHHGAIGVESTPGEGSTFWFTLPLQPPPAEVEGPISGPLEPP